MREQIYRELAKIDKKEQRLFRANDFVDWRILTKKLEAKIPPGFHEKLNTIFYQGFKLVLRNGVGVIEKTYDKGKSQAEYDVNNYAFTNLGNKQGVRRLVRTAHKKHLTNLGLAAGEGSVLGLLGIGLPDIPIFLGVLLKSVYEIALSFGFDYESEAEKYYILLLFQGALGNGAKKQRLNGSIDQVAAQLDKHAPVTYDFDLETRITADALATDLLVLKFVQGLPLIGVVGGVTNVVYCNKVTEYAKLKYKKRYLLKKLAP